MEKGKKKEEKRKRGRPRKINDSEKVNNCLTSTLDQKKTGGEIPKEQLYAHSTSYIKKLIEESKKIPKETLEKIIEESEKEDIIYQKRLKKEREEKEEREEREEIDEQINCFIKIIDKLTSEELEKIREKINEKIEKNKFIFYTEQLEETDEIIQNLKKETKGGEKKGRGRPRKLKN